jgi:hypothetical protein
LNQILQRGKSVRSFFRSTVEMRRCFAMHSTERKATKVVKKMNAEIEAYNESQATVEERQICARLATLVCELLPAAESKIWHRHPVWFLNENPTVGYSKLKAGIRLMFWSGASFDEDKLIAGTGKFKDASVVYTHPDQINVKDMRRWIKKAKTIQWDYKNLVRRKGKLVRIK